MLLISLGLHGLLLILPVPQKPQPQPAKPVKLEKVKITDLLVPSRQVPHNVSSQPPTRAIQPQPPRVAPSAAAPQPILLPPKVAPSPLAPQPILKPTAVMTPTSTLVPPAKPIATPTPKSTPTATLTPTPSPTPAPSPSNTEAEKGELSGFLAQLANPANQPSPDLFAEPGEFFDELNPPKLKPDILSATWTEDKSPIQVAVAILNNPANSQNFSNEQLGNYGGGEVYKVTQGSNVWYFNFVPTQDLRGTIIVVWKHDPSTEERK